MAKYRTIQTKFWSDPFIMELTPEQKFFYIYLITNPATTQCGIYEISIKKMAFETGYNTDTIEKLIDIFTENKKMIYCRETNEVCLVNFLRHNSSSSPKIMACINKELEEVKNKELIPLIYGMHTLSNPDVYPIHTLSNQILYPMEGASQEKEKEKEKENSKIPYLNLSNSINELSLTDEQKTERINAVYDELKNSEIWLTDVQRIASKSEADVKTALRKFCIEIKAKDRTGNSLRELKEYFINWIKKN